MTVQKLLDVLNNKKEIPAPTEAKIFFCYINDKGEQIDLNLDGIGGFTICSDVVFRFTEDKDIKTSIK